MIRDRSSKMTAIVIILASGLVAVPSITKARNAVIHSIPVGVFPTHMVATPDGSRIYVVNQGGPGTDPNTERNNRGSLSVIDASGSTATVTTPFDVGFPIGLASTPDGSRIYVAISSYLGNVQTTGSPRVEVIDTATNTIAATVRAPGTEPTEVAITPDGFRVYVTNRGTGTVLVINTANNVMQGTISVGPEPFGIAITADGRRAYVVLRAQGVVKVIDVDRTPPRSIL